MREYETEIAQDETEIEIYCELLRRENVRSYLEIGSKFGGSLWRAARSLPVGSKIVSVDMPNGTKVWKQSSRSLTECVEELRRLGYDARVIWSDSQSRDTVNAVAQFAPFDAIMIDADHRAAGVALDWKNYYPMSQGIIAFHDIGWKRAPEWVGVRIDVPEFWDSIKDKFMHREIKRCKTGKNNGIGVLWK